jgi:hypothetical protein
MNRLPNRLPESGLFRALYRWLNQLRDFVAATEPKGSENVRVTRTSRGSFVEAMPTSQAEETSTTTGKAYWA